jgi:hypothetical protein
LKEAFNDDSSLLCLLKNLGDPGLLLKGLKKGLELYDFYSGIIDINDCFLRFLSDFSRLLLL